MMIMPNQESERVHEVVHYIHSYIHYYSMSVTRVSSKPKKNVNANVIEQIEN